MADLDYNEIMDACVATTLASDGKSSVTTSGPIPKNTWDRYKIKFVDQIEFLRWRKVPGQAAASTGNPTSGNIGWGDMQKRMIV